MLVGRKWRQLIRGTEEDSDDSGGYCVQLFLVLAHLGYPGLKVHKMVVVVVTTFSFHYTSKELKICLRITFVCCLSVLCLSKTA